MQPRHPSFLSSPECKLSVRLSDGRAKRVAALTVWLSGVGLRRGRAYKHGRGQMLESDPEQQLFNQSPPCHKLPKCQFAAKRERITLKESSENQLISFLSNRPEGYFCTKRPQGRVKCIWQSVWKLAANFGVTLPLPWLDSVSVTSLLLSNFFQLAVQYEPLAVMVPSIARGDELHEKTMHFRGKEREREREAFRTKTPRQLRRLITCRANLTTKDKLGNNYISFFR